MAKDHEKVKPSPAYSPAVALLPTGTQTKNSSVPYTKPSTNVILKAFYKASGGYPHIKSLPSRCQLGDIPSSSAKINSKIPQGCDKIWQKKIGAA